MIDKSLRQHYQDGDEVKKLKIVEMGEKLTAPFKNKYIEQDTGKIKKGEVAKDIGINFAKKAVAKKLGLASLNPILGLLSLMGIDPISWLTKKMTEGGVEEAHKTGFTGLGVGSPQEGKELRVLENRRANMLQRKEEGRNYSERNLDMVTRAIAEAKGLDINNPNEMENIDKPITQIQIEKRITEAPQIIPEEPEVKSPFAKVIPKTPEVIIPHLEGDRTIPTPTPDFAFEDAKRAAQEKAELQREVTRQAEANAARIRAEQARAAGPHGNGGGGGHHGHTETRSSSGWESSPFKKGGRVDKALGGRSRDI